jgi:hypothetical protein
LFLTNYGYYQTSADLKSQIALYENTGTASAPAFTLIDEDYENISQVGLSYGLFPAFEDLDGDGDKDMMLGNQTGTISYFENIAAAGADADFVVAQPVLLNSGNQPIDIGLNATPHFADLDRDGDFDMLVGERNGNINYFENVGDASSFSFELITDTLGNVDVTEYFSIAGQSVPFVFEDGGEFQLLVGSNSGYLHRYTDIDNNLAGVFTLLDSTFHEIYDGPQSAPALLDLNNDGLLDLMVGNYRGGLSYFEGSTVNTVTAPSVEVDLFKAYPNPANEQLQIKFNQNITGPFHVKVYNSLGQIAIDLSATERTLTLSTVALKPGIYFCQADNGTHSNVIKLIIKH